jgi:hypothetical protein
VVAAELVGVGDGLLEGEARVGGVVDAEGRGAACGEEGGRGRGEGEDLGWVRWGWVGWVSWGELLWEGGRGMAGLRCAPSSTVWAVRYCFDWCGV